MFSRTLDAVRTIGFFPFRPYHNSRTYYKQESNVRPRQASHGTVLWTLAEHYFMTRNRKWLEHAPLGMLRGADWITGERRLTMVLDGTEKPPTRPASSTG